MYNTWIQWNTAEKIQNTERALFWNGNMHLPNNYKRKRKRKSNNWVASPLLFFCSPPQITWQLTPCEAERVCHLTATELTKADSGWESSIANSTTTPVAAGDRLRVPLFVVHFFFLCIIKHKETKAGGTQKAYWCWVIRKNKQRFEYAWMPKWIDNVVCNSVFAAFANCQSAWGSCLSGYYINYIHTDCICSFGEHTAAWHQQNNCCASLSACYWKSVFKGLEHEYPV